RDCPRPLRRWRRATALYGAALHADAIADGEFAGRVRIEVHADAGAALRDQRPEQLAVGGDAIGLRAGDDHAALGPLAAVRGDRRAQSHVAAGPRVLVGRLDQDIGPVAA